MQVLDFDCILFNVQFGECQLLTTRVDDRLVLILSTFLPPNRLLIFKSKGIWCFILKEPPVHPDPVD